jgi:5-methylcytosine-specific restriction endonuclease McrA
VADAQLLWRLANTSTLKVLRGEFRGQYHIILGRTEPITDFFAGLPQLVDRKGLRVDVWTEPAPSSAGEEIPPWRLTIRRMNAGMARPLEWYIGSQQPGATHPLWRPDTGPTDATEPDTDRILLLRTADDRFFAGWLRQDEAAGLPDRLRARIEALETSADTLSGDEVEAVLVALDQPSDLGAAAQSGIQEAEVGRQIAAETKAPSAQEGQLVTIQHSRRERSRLLRGARIEAAGERPTCEACGFDFELVYGHRGRGFIECHHLIPISELDPAIPTRLDDLALLCANCHRMVHVRRPWLTIDELKLLLAEESPAGK